jgi:putative acetyltransferase
VTIAAYPLAVSFTIRPLADDDVPAVAAVFRRSKETAMPWLPDLHTPAEDLVYFGGEVASSSGWGACAGDELLGFALCRPGWLNHLYVAPPWRGHGVGGALLACVIAQNAGDLDLWAFQRNEPALAFYRDRGFVEVERTDGAGNQEREPDVRLRRPGSAGIGSPTPAGT